LAGFHAAIVAHGRDADNLRFDGQVPAAACAGRVETAITPA
jgi:hypothetical protein